MKSNAVTINVKKVDEPPIPPKPPAEDFDKDGVAYVQPLLESGFKISTLDETWDFDDNFRSDGHRYDFNGMCWESKEVVGYFFIPEDFDDDEISGKLNGGPHNNSNPSWADVMDMGIIDLDGTKSRMRWEKTHPQYSGSLNVQNVNIGPLYGKWVGARAMKLNLDTNGDGQPDKVALIGMVDVGNGSGGLDSSGKPVNNWQVTQFKIWDPEDIGLKSLWVNYVCTIGEGSESQETIRIDNSPPSGLLHKFVSCKELRADPL